MTKLIAALHGPKAATALHDPALHRRLAGAGATALQVNVDDAAVAPAMRFGPGEPITGFVTVWTDDADATLAVLAGLAEDPHVYRVTERRPVEPPVVTPGVRADALANIAVLRRPEGMSRERYLEIWLGDHTAIASETQHTFGYIQNVVEEALTPGAPEISAIVEELFLMAGMTDVHAFYGSGGDDAELDRRITRLMTSVARFGAGDGLDLVPTSRYLYEV
ncbi:hypothetical protein EFK50_05190 [Nocardioides marmoriginsengisoli]|uniref:EthD domain-containing protein n=1 Tax=Nocardioides marmoriginsengisoli TaxID=661483 RepID=A0A3N0CPF5_9ACTN|nr:hypothetical protein [Nocardioides marmoriginsengisoli]RNL65354.1 hypothetical protein EFK50_05190 [Nocardioides marmoriginsengisoli]